MDSGGGTGRDLRCTLVERVEVSAATPSQGRLAHFDWMIRGPSRYPLQAPRGNSKSRQFFKPDSVCMLP